MIFNSLMSSIFESINLDNVKCQDGYFIWKGLTQSGKPFWGVGDFCGLSKKTSDTDVDLMALEWNGNEIYINHTSDISNMLLYGLEIVKAWKMQMETDYAGIPFDILLSIDDGDESVKPSLTIRFYAVRNQVHYVNPLAEELEAFKQPILMEQANYSL